MSQFLHRAEILVALVNVSMTGTARVWRTLTLPSSAVARVSTRSSGRSGFNLVWPSGMSGLMHDTKATKSVC